MAGEVSPQDFEFLRDLVMREAGLVLDSGKEYLVSSRLEPVARAEKLDGVSALLTAVRNAPAGRLRALVIDAMTTNETLFFRDAHPFEAMTNAIVPQLMQTRASTRTIDIWCAAASTGQEPYSIAMLLKEHFPQLSTWRVNIYATDISGSALARAREGRYSQMEVGRGLPARYMVKYFTRVGTDWQISQEIRSMVTFKAFNLAAPWPRVGPYDLIFMRNVLIYFSQDTKREIVTRAIKTLRSTGALLLGSSESLLGMESQIERDKYEKTTFYRPITQIEAGAAV